MLPGVPVHLVHRGNNRQACFPAENDRRFYLHHLRRLVKETPVELHAYCLMTNHVHLLLTSATESGCAQLMQRLAQIHTQYINKTYERSGTLWEGRFRSCLVQEEDYLLACYRYVEANPVRAGIVRDPGDFDWSSHRANIGSDWDPAITPGDPRYWRTEEIRSATNGNYVLGSDAFKRAMAVRLGRRVEPGKPGRGSAPQPLPGQLGLLDEESVVCPC